MASPSSVDLGNLPEQRPPRRAPQRAIILWLVVFGLITFFLPFYLVSTAIRADNTRLETDLKTAQDNLTRGYAPAPDVQELMATLDQVQQSASAIEQAYPTVVAGRTDWLAIMAAIGNYDPTQLALTSLTHADNRITLNGQAIDDAAVVAYARSLEESNLFSRVVVQSMQAIATPFATPTSTSEVPGATPTGIITPSVTGSPSPSPSDGYETDDFQPKDIILGQPQSHNFNPIYDVDKVKFLAKAGRYYRVYTFDLAPGVDTFLTVSVAGTTYTNDDYQPGDLSSEVIFQVGSGRDVEAIVKVTNRGQYSPDMWYQINVEEVVPTPTPTPTNTPIPTPTNTSTPTATPTITATPTPDRRDSYESDDTDPKPIAVGETQSHNFYPANDVDSCKFLAKAGRYYRVSTSNLALGVDTSLTVTVTETVYTNDDRQPGDLSSEIIFQAPTGQDVEAVIKVTNRGQYDPDMWYRITVEEVIPTPTPIPPATTPSASSRLPGPASLAPGFALANHSRPAQMIAERTDAFPNPTGGERRRSDILQSKAVAFVIVLELKTGSP